MKCLEIHQENLHCQQCLNNIIIILSQLHNIEYLDIDISKRLIKLKYKDNDMNEQKIRYLIDYAANAKELF